LAGKAGIICSGVFEQHSIGEFGADRELLFGENKVRHLGEAKAGDGVRADDLNIAGDVSEPVRDMLPACIIACSEARTLVMHIPANPGISASDRKVRGGFRINPM
jgi:hypothetical protein